MKVVPLPILGPDGKALPPGMIYDPPKPYIVKPGEVMPLPTRPPNSEQDKHPKDGI